MARKFTAGAEFGGTLTDSDYDSLSGTTISWDTGTVRSGGFAWKFLSSASSPFLTRQYTSAANDSYVRGYINVASMTTASSISIFLIRDATNGNNVNIRLTRTSATTFTLALFNEQTGLQVGSSSGSLNTNTWYRVEFSYVNATGAMAAYIDGVQFASGTGTASLGSNTLRWGSIDASTMTIFFDDLAVNDQTAGGTQTGLPGDGAVVRAKPNAQGDVNTFGTQTGGTAGVANAFTRLNEITPDDATTFDGSSTLNQEDLVKVDVSGVPTTATVNVVEVWARFRNSTADTTAAIKFEIEKAAAGTIAQSAAIVPNSTTWKMNALAVPKAPPLVLYQDPSSVNWNPATWAPQVGYKLTTGPAVGSRRIDVTSVSAIIDFLTTTTSTSTTTTSTSTTTSSSTSSSTTTTSTSSSTTSSTSSSTTTTSTSSSTSSSTTTTSTSSSTTTTSTSTSSSTTTTSTSSSSSTSITTSTTTTLALLETLIDPWDTIDLTRWQDFSSGNAVADGQLHFTSATNTVIWDMDTVHNYDMRNSHVTHQVISYGGNSPYWDPIIIEVYDSGNRFNNFEYFVENGRLTAQTQTDAGGTDFTDIVYDPATMQYFRIRETSGTVYYEYSARGDTWTILRSEPTPFDVSSVFVELSVFSGDNISRTIVLDNLNILTTTSTSSSTTTTSTSSSTTTSTSSSTTSTSTSSSTSLTTSTSTTHTTTSTSSTTSTSLTTSTSSSTTTTSTSSSSSSSTTLTQTTTSTSTSITTSTTQTIELGFNIGQPPSYAMEDSFINSIPTDE